MLKSRLKPQQQENVGLMSCQTTKLGACTYANVRIAVIIGAVGKLHVLIIMNYIGLRNVKVIPRLYLYYIHFS